MICCDYIFARHAAVIGAYLRIAQQSEAQPQ